MKQGGGKSKGATFEREVCSKLSLWVSKGERDDLFWRSSMSGGRATVRFQKGKDTVTAGDITAIHEMGSSLTDNYIIECKFTSNIHLESAIFQGPLIDISKVTSKKKSKKKGKPKQRQNNADKFAAWWMILLREGKKYNKKPMLIAKQNRQKTLIGIPLSLNQSDLAISAIRLFKLNPMPIAILPKLGIELYDFEEFIKVIRYENFNR